MTTTRKRREPGEGSIYQRKNGKWCGQISVGAEGGKRKRKYIYGDTSKEVVAQMKVLLRDQQQGKNIAPTKYTVAQFLAVWLEEVVKPNARTNTYTGYEQMIRLHIVPELGPIDLQKLSAPDVQRLINRKVASGLKPWSVSYIHKTLRAALNQAVDWDILTRNIASRVSPPTIAKTEVAALDPEQVQKLMKALVGDRLETLYILTIATGLRRGEVLGLKWEDIDFKKATLTVRHNLQRVAAGVELQSPKTEASKRVITIPAFALTSLHAHRARQLRERASAGPQWEESGAVFCKPTGEMLHPETIMYQFVKVLKRAELPHMRFHDLRHTCATLLLLQGVQPHVVQGILGHSTIAETMNTYSHVLPSQQNDAAQRMDSIFTQQK